MTPTPSPRSRPLRSGALALGLCACGPSTSEASTMDSSGSLPADGPSGSTEPTTGTGQGTEPGVPVTTAASATSTADSSATLDSESASDAGDTALTFGPADVGNGFVHECNPTEGRTACESDTYCVPNDALGTGLWSGSTCVPRPHAPKVAGSACTIPDGPIQGQADCGPWLVCAAPAKATEGVCIPICDETGACAVGRCTPCSDPAIGVCLEGVDCGPEGCIAAGCV